MSATERNHTRRIEKQSVQSGRTKKWSGASQPLNRLNLISSGAVVDIAEYVYDSTGNRIAMRVASGERVTWSYDNAYKLVNERRSGASGYNTTFTYDAAGNRLVKNASGVRTTSVFDAANQLQTSTDATGVTNYTFDANGNQQIVVAPTGNRTTYVWNYDNQYTLVQQSSGGRETMAYNAEFRRVQKDK